MIVIGLTGSLATGKSTVSRLLSAPPYSFPIIDADILARQVVEPGTYGYRQTLKHFGPTTPDLLLPQHEDKNGKGRPINRPALGRRVFGNDPERIRDRKILNDIIHPLVRLAMVRQMVYYYLLGYWAVVLDIPLLFESGLDIFVSIVMMVSVTSPEVQMKRLRERDKALSAREAEERVGSQMGVEEKVKRTRARGMERGKVVLNDGGMGDLEAEVRRVIAEVRDEGRGGLWGWWLWGSPVGAMGVGAWEVWKSWRARSRWQEEKVQEKARL
ncbi:Dephospho-CoA kinase cab5 [Lecanora helva]